MDQAQRILTTKVIKRRVCDGRYQMILNDMPTEYFIEIDDPAKTGDERKWNVLFKEELLNSHRMLQEAADAAAGLVISRYLSAELQQSTATPFQ